MTGHLNSLVRVSNPHAPGAHVEQPIATQPAIEVPAVVQCPEPVALPCTDPGYTATVDTAVTDMDTEAQDPASASFELHDSSMKEVPMHELATLTAQLTQLQLQPAQSCFALPEHCNDCSQYFQAAKPLLIDCRAASAETVIQAVFHSLHSHGQLHRPVQYWVVPHVHSAKYMPLLNDMRVVYRSSPGSSPDYLVLSDEKCHPAVTLGSVVCSPAAALQVPLSWQLDTPTFEPEPQKRSAIATQVTLQALAADQLLFVHPAVLSGVPCRVLFDTGASRSFVDLHFAKQHKIPLQKHTNCTVTLGNGDTVHVSTVSRPLTLQVGHVQTTAVLIGLALNSAFDVVLGQDYMSKHSAVLETATGAVIFGGERVPMPSAQGEAHKGISDIATSSPVNLMPDMDPPQVVHCTVEAALSAGECPILAKTCAQGTVQDAGMDIAIESPDTQTLGMTFPEVMQHPAEVALTMAQFCEMVKDVPAAGVLCMLRTAAADVAAAPALDCSSDIDLGDGPVPKDELLKVLNEFADRFQAATTVSTSNLVHTIPLQEGAQPINQRAYRTPQQLLPELEEQIKGLLEKGWIRPSSSPWGSPVLFVPKKDGGWRMCIDYRALNRVTIKNSWPLPRIEDLLDKLVKAKVFTTLDLAQGYHQFAVHPDDVEKTAFKTPLGLFEYTVLPFGLTNAPATFSRKMQELFCQYMVGPDAFVLVYIDDILIHSESAAEHLQHVRKVLQVLKDANLVVKLKKCSFNRTKVEYLGHIVGAGTVSADPKKVSAVAQFPQPSTVTELRSFLGLANYFRKFVQGYAAMAAPLHALTAGNLPKQTQLQWTKASSKAFQQVKDALCNAPVLQIFDPAKETQVVADASGFAVGAVLLQDGLPVAYESRKLNVHEKNYSVSDKELLAVKHALQVWRHYLLHKKFTVITDHRPNVTLQTCKSIGDTSGRRARWSELLQQYNIAWQYRPGATNIADVLSRSPHLSAVVQMWKVQDYIAGYAGLQFGHADMPHECTARALTPAAAHVLSAVVTRRRAAVHGTAPLIEEHSAAPDSTLASQTDPDLAPAGSPYCDNKLAGDVQVSVPEAMDGVVCDQVPQVPVSVDLPAVSQAEISAGVNSREVPSGETLAGGMDRTFLSRVHSAVNEQQEFVLKLAEQTGYVLKDNLLHDVQGRLILPPGPLRQEMIEEAHSPMYVGHGGLKKTMHHLALAGVAWPGMTSDVRDFIARCDSCQRNKSSTQAPAGELVPLEIPSERWDTITMDLITDLPVTIARHDAVVVFVDKLSKMVELVPCRKTIDSAGFAELFVNAIVLRYGVPRVIVSDRDPRFTSAFMRAVVSLLGTKQALSTAFHPQTDGQTEVMNRVLEQYLRHYVSAHCKDWDAYLSCAAFAINNSRSSATGLTPYYLNYGRHPRTPLTSWQTVVSSNVPAASAFRQRIAEAMTLAKACLSKAQDSMKSAADKHRRPAPTYQVGQEVLLSTRNLAFKGFKKANAKKLLPRWIGPFQIEALVGKVAVRLSLLKTMGIHPVFHVSLVKPYLHDGTSAAPPPVLTLENDVQFEVDHILAQRGRGRTLQYLVRWRGYSPQHDSWEPASELKNAPEVVAAWQKAQQQTGRV